ASASGPTLLAASHPPLLTPLFPLQTGIDFVQRENPYDDYADQVLLPHKMSEQGPFLATGDVNGDGLEDIYFGAPSGQAGALYLQDGNGKFRARKVPAFEQDKEQEDAHPAFFDADGDGDLDLLVASGGYEFPENSPLYQPRLYLNDGNGNFQKAASALPPWPYSSSTVRPVDYDGDGDLDVFIGGLLTPKKYPLPGKSALFLNDGMGRFREITAQCCPELSEIGMVKDACGPTSTGTGAPTSCLPANGCPLPSCCKKTESWSTEPPSTFPSPWWDGGIAYGPPTWTGTAERISLPATWV
ncbi:MAG: hypothetical protein D6812_15595, partial [Deltaproteobacteria bacterium]